jgi:hypothetical protein
MDHDLIVEQLLDRCQSFIERILEAPGSQAACFFSVARGPVHARPGST